MSSIDAKIRGYYGRRGNLLSRILSALADRGIDAAQPHFRDLYSLDQLHGGGISATREHADRAGIRCDMHVLELGCGIGGAARYLAGEIGCRVTAIDLTPEFVEIARDLTRRCQLLDRIEFREASALDLPFPDVAFDHVFSHNATMNIADKARLSREVFRVLKGGGRFSCAEVGQGPRVPLIFPLPWASDASTSFLVRPADMCRNIEASGFRVSSPIDLTDLINRSRQPLPTSAVPNRQLARLNERVMGEALLEERMRNAAKCAAERRTVEYLIIAEKP